MPFAHLCCPAQCLIWLVAIGVVSCQKTSAPVRATEKHIRPKIVRGKEAPVGRFPYMCSLRLRGSREHKCGGMVIDHRWVLTAAHCVDPDSTGSVGFQPVIYCGIHEIDDDSPEMTFTAIDGVLHPRWNGEVDKGFDIALLKLDRETNTPSPDILSKENPLSSGSRLAALGWGKTESSNYSEKLRVTTDLVFVPPGICRNSGYNVDDDRMVCAGLSHENTCEGDSGGPLLLPDVPKGELNAGRPNLDLLVGITSYGLGSCTDESSTLGIYTRVGYYSEWILSVVGNTANLESKPETRTFDGEMIMPPVVPEDEDSAPRSALEIDFDDDYVDHIIEFYSEPADREPTEGPSAAPSESAQRPQSGPCAIPPRLADVVAAIRDDDVAIVRAALECGLDPDSRYNTIFQRYDRTLLHWAALYDSSDSAKALGDFGANVEARDSFGDTPLHNCGLFGSASVAKVLLDNEANVNARGHFRFTPLHFAARHGPVDVAKVLLARGAEVDAKDEFGQIPLHLAAREDHADTVKTLVGKGADIDAADTAGETPLHEAAEWGNDRVVEALIEEGADVDAQDESGWTPLHGAAHRGRTDTIKILVDAGADIEATDAAGETPLHEAAWKGHNNVVQALIEEGADVDAKEDVGRTPLHLAAIADQADTIRILAAAGADIDATDAADETPLHEAAESGNNRAVEALIDEGADVDSEGRYGDTPLHLAARRGHADTVKVLVDGGADVDAADSNGETSLHHAADFGHLDAVRVLVNAGASKTIRDNYGARPKNVVCRGANPECTRATRHAIKELVAP